MFSNRCRIIICVLLLVALHRGSVQSDALTRFEFSQAHMGTWFRIALYATDAETATRAANAAFECVARLDAIMSDYRETSELIQACRQASARPVKVGDDLFRVLAKSQEIAGRTDGAFDVTAGPVVRLWRRARRTGEMPDAKRLSQALDLTGHKKLHLDHKTNSLRLDKPGMLLDLGGIAKGYAADEAIAVLKKHGIHRAMVAAGGDVVASQAPPGARGWVIAIAPFKGRDELEMPPLLLSDAAVSTSGDAEQYVEINGVRYSHIVDPKTGLGVMGQSSVTVVASSGAASDAMATAVSVLGPEKGLRFIDSTEGAAALVVQGNGPQLQVFKSKRWDGVQKRELRAERLFHIKRE